MLCYVLLVKVKGISTFRLIKHKNSPIIVKIWSASLIFISPCRNSKEFYVIISQKRSLFFFNYKNNLILKSALALMSVTSRREGAYSTNPLLRTKFLHMNSLLAFDSEFLCKNMLFWSRGCCARTPRSEWTRCSERGVFFVCRNSSFRTTRFCTKPIV